MDRHYRRTNIEAIAEHTPYDEIMRRFDRRLISRLEFIRGHDAVVEYWQSLADKEADLAAGPVLYDESKLADSPDGVVGQVRKLVAAVPDAPGRPGDPHPTHSAYCVMLLRDLLHVRANVQEVRVKEVPDIGQEQNT